MVVEGERPHAQRARGESDAVREEEREGEPCGGRHARMVK
jgi:hypothetical protein